ncbi:zinc-binding alcohol dehydrogenase family protein [Xenorhabdus khoisanae]|uniref:zinc-binding alcohol dehydrogenase family protein n=1 Tax=Xenorhabdus khoisanae TaxID=880157 RepID=UPI002358D8B3|nr:zinc-binding alcohol dehydrogenase family protein [Xenorhabdus khoisanae]MDC9616268.1 zinc-binding alcohol dehydrogenase family protein [Xenorhabdus khoisanae]
MKSIIYRHSSPLTHPDVFRSIETPMPIPGPHDLLVSVQAVSVNPVDTKIRSGNVTVPDTVTTLGWDAAGIVKAVGANVTLFKPGEPIFYAGTFTRQGANSEFHLVDERLVGPKPKSLSFAQAAALPLTALTAWELLFDRFGIVPGKTTNQKKETLLIVGGSGGVGSILIQIARRLTNMTVIATASRVESREWCFKLGAHHVVDHSKPLAKEVAALNISPITHIAALAHTNKHFSALTELITPQGKIAIIDDHDYLDAVPLKGKSVSLHWEMVFTRPLYQTEDMIAHHQILTEIAFLVDAGVLRSTLTKELHTFDVENLKFAHALVEQGNMLGKVVISRT